MSLRLPLFFQLTKKLGEALPMLGGKMIFLTEVQIIAQPLLVGTMGRFRDCIPVQAVLELCLQLRRNGEHMDISEKRTNIPFRKPYRKSRSRREKSLVKSFRLMYKNVNMMHRRAALLLCLMQGPRDVLKV